MDIHRAQLRSAANTFDTEKEDLGGFVAEAAEELNAIGAFWGDDGHGARFVKGEGGAGGYEAVTGQLIQGIEVLLGAHDEIAGRLRLMARLVHVADWESVADILARLPPADPDRPVWGAGA